MSLHSDLLHLLPGAVQRRLTNIPLYVDALLTEAESDVTSLRELSSEDREQLRGIGMVRALIEQLSSAIEFASAAVKEAEQFGAESIRIGSLILHSKGTVQRQEAEALAALRDMCDAQGLTERVSEKSSVDKVSYEV
jgi:hypothetical protein